MPCSATIRGTYPRSSPDLRLRIRAHPGAYRAPRALVTVPIRQARVERSRAPTLPGSTERTIILYSRITPPGIRIDSG